MAGRVYNFRKRQGFVHFRFDLVIPVWQSRGTLGHLSHERESIKGQRKMSRSKIALILPLVLVIGVCTAGRASASPEWFQFGPVESADIVTLKYAPAGLTGGEYYAGQYKGTTAATQAGLSSPTATTFQTFCVDLFHDVTDNQQYQVTPTATVPTLNNGAQVNWLYQSYGESQITGTYSTLVVDGQTFHNVAANDYAAALQLAIWTELANSGSMTGPLSYTLVTGNSSTVLALVSDFLAAAASSTQTNGTFLQSDASQPAGYTQGQSFIVSPAPPTLKLGALALCCVIPVCCWRRRRPA
jgi:hypothetical protein